MINHWFTTDPSLFTYVMGDLGRPAFNIISIASPWNAQNTSGNPIANIFTLRSIPSLVTSTTTKPVVIGCNHPRHDGFSTYIYSSSTFSVQVVPSFDLRAWDSSRFPYRVLSNQKSWDSALSHCLWIWLFESFGVVTLAGSRAQKASISQLYHRAASGMYWSACYFASLIPTCAYIPLSRLSEM